MPNYMLLLYAPEVGPAEQAEREAEMSLWFELNDSLREAGLLVATGRLHPAAAATTLRVRDGEAELTAEQVAHARRVVDRRKVGVIRRQPAPNREPNRVS